MRGDVVTVNDIGRLKYLRNCLNEVLRFTAQSSFSARVSPDRDIKLSNGGTNEDHTRSLDTPIRRTARAVAHHTRTHTHTSVYT